MPRHVTDQLCGWGNYAARECKVYRPERAVDVRGILREGEPHGLISRGLGRSYGDSAVSEQAGVILHARQNRFLAFDATTGVVEAEAGVSLAEILDAFVPRGFFLPVTPGTKFVSLGGAIAADVHGKNHHRDGSFSRFVESLELMTGTGDVLRCSATENSEAFWATVGGMGLTGIILTARLRLVPIPSAYIKVDYKRAQNLDQAIELFAAGDAEYQFSVAWIDCLARGEKLGRSVLMRGNFAQVGDLQEWMKPKPLQLPKKRTKNVPFKFPGFALNSMSIKVFNALYYWKHKDGRKIVDYNSFFYPLDSIRNWSRMYGKRGFLQYQVALPPQEARAGMTKILGRLAESKRASFLAVLKTFGPGGDGLLSFPMPGLTLALDLPYRPGLVEMLRETDRMVLDHGGRVYLAKDACVEPGVFATMYPNLPKFKEIKAKLDPENKMGSTQSRRLGITEAV